MSFHPGKHLLFSRTQRVGWIVTFLVATVPTFAANAVNKATPAGTTEVPSSNASAAPHVVPDLGLELIWIPPGTFMMGSPPGELSHKAEGPQTKVTLTHGFWLGRTEVTQVQYEAITGTNPSSFRAAGPNAPVEHVSWIVGIPPRARCDAVKKPRRIRFLNAPRPGGVRRARGGGWLSAHVGRQEGLQSSAGLRAAG